MCICTYFNDRSILYTYICVYIDQQWWPRPLAMYGSGNLSAEINHYDTINTDNGKYVVHKVYPLSATVPIVSYFNMSGSTKKHRQHLYAEASKRFIY